MKQHIAHISLLVADYDEAIKFYTQKLNFTLIEDTPISEDKRWVLIAPSGSRECGLLLAKASSDEQKKYIGNQTGGRVFLFLYSDILNAIIRTLFRKRYKLLEHQNKKAMVLWPFLLISTEISGI